MDQPCNLDESERNARWYGLSMYACMYEKREHFPLALVCTTLLSACNAPISSRLKPSQVTFSPLFILSQQLYVLERSQNTSSLEEEEFEVVPVVENEEVDEVEERQPLGALLGFESFLEFEFKSPPLSLI